jgi:CRP/FNR family transcriptional regulator, cyclic AMP receptor protein
MQKSKKRTIGKSQRISKADPGVRADQLGLVAKIDAKKTLVEYRAKEPIFRQGDPARAVFYLVSGKVQLVVVSKQGREAVVAILEAGAFFGEGCLISQSLRMASAIAIEDSVVVRIEKGTMIRALREQPAFAKSFMEYLLTRNVQVESDLVDQLFNSSEKRLARILLLLAHIGNNGKMRMVVPKINQETLAAKVGTTRSRINYFMNKFRKLGLIEYNGDLKVHSALMNVIVHD